MEQTFFDANVVLELLLGRKNKQAIIKRLTAGGEAFCISPLTVHLCYHFGLAAGISFDTITNLLNTMIILNMDDQVVGRAQDLYRGTDFEDCLQAATAELGNCSAILTFDRKFQKHSGTSLKVEVL